MENQDNKKPTKVVEELNKTSTELFDELSDMMTTTEVSVAKGKIEGTPEVKTHFIDQLKDYGKAWLDKNKVRAVSSRMFIVKTNDKPVSLSVLTHMCYMDSLKEFESQSKGGDFIFSEKPSAQQMTSVFKVLTPLIEVKWKGGTTIDVWMDTMNMAPGST